MPNTTPLDTNLSPLGAASQSTTRFGGAASRAINGNTSGVYSQNSVTHTNTQSEPWWEMSLAEQSTINSMVLYNRTDNCCSARLSNVHVFVSEQPFGNQTLTQLLARDDIAHVYLSGAQGSEIPVPITGTGSYVRVQLAGTGVLSLAEVEVLGYGHSALGGQ